MIKAKGRRPSDGRIVIVIGLSRANCDRLLADASIAFVGEEIDIPGFDFVVIGGENEEALRDVLSCSIGPNTRVIEAKRH